MTEAQDDITTPHTTLARRLLLEAALLGILADGALRNAPGGLGWTIWILGLALGAIIVAKQRGDRIGREQAAWLFAAVACAAVLAWRDSEELQAWSVLGTLAALAMFSMVSSGAPVPSILAARLRDAIAACVYAARDGVVAPLLLIFRDAQLGASIRALGTTRATAIRAALLTLPLVVVFTALLSQADPVFASIFSLPAIDAEVVASHIMLAGVFAWLSAGWMRGALLGVWARPKLPSELPVRLGVAEVTTALGALVALFALFVGLQLRWLFGGADVVLATTGLTVAEYARRGFFELVTVAALVVPVILGTRAAIVDEHGLRRHRQLSFALVGLLGAIMISAMLRMRLYVMHFGLTTDRLYASVFMVWLAVVFFCMALTVLRGWARPFATMTAVSALAALFALSAANPEAIVARTNLERSTTARETDYAYLGRLSGDAAPIVVEALTKASPSENACAAAKSMRLRWVGAKETSANLGARRGRAAAVATLTPDRVQQLCAIESASAP